MKLRSHILTAADLLMQSAASPRPIYSSLIAMNTFDFVNDETDILFRVRIVLRGKS